MIPVEPNSSADLFPLPPHPPENTPNSSPPFPTVDNPKKAWGTVIRQEVNSVERGKRGGLSQYDEGWVDCGREEFFEEEVSVEEN